jgi:hypothetical protein
MAKAGIPKRPKHAQWQVSSYPPAERKIGTTKSAVFRNFCGVRINSDYKGEVQGKISAIFKDFGVF